MKFTEKIKEKKRPLLLDGAMGALLQSRNLRADEHLWSSVFNITAPQQVLNLHREYVEAGAEIITTNTFRTNPTAVKLSSYKTTSEELVVKAVELAKRAVEDKDVLIAGSNAPAEDCYQREVTISKGEIEYNHSKHIELLWESGVDFILNETLGHLFEIEFVSKFCQQNKLPFVTSIYFDENLKLLSGEPLEAAIETVLAYSPLAVCFNCIHSQIFADFKKEREFNFNWGFYFNCGGEDISAEPIFCNIFPDDYIEQIKPLIDANTVIIGACCGSTPEHIAKLRKFLDEHY